MWALWLRYFASWKLSRQSAIPSSRLASSIANVGVENCGINQRGTSQNVSHSPGHANPHFAHFQILFLLPLSVISVCHKNDFDVQILTWRQPYVAINVCGKGNGIEDDIGFCYERRNTEWWANLGISFLVVHAGIKREKVTNKLFA